MKFLSFLENDFLPLRSLINFNIIFHPRFYDSNKKNLLLKCKCDMLTNKLTNFNIQRFYIINFYVKMPYLSFNKIFFLLHSTSNIHQIGN